MPRFTLNALHQALDTISVPEVFTETARRYVRADGREVELIRHERSDGASNGLGGEHVSMLVEADGRLTGFARMDGALVGCEPPSREAARATAMRFLDQVAPDVLDELEVRWVEPHHERLRVDGAVRSVSGMKVKMLNRADGRWLWVIVGGDGSVMVFERDIVWITMPGHRKTEKWLHDSWIEEAGWAEMFDAAMVV